jgi:hypothetical protein
MAAPHVSGTAALLCALSPGITMQKLRSLMMYSGYAAPWQFLNVHPLSTGRAVDANKAVQGVSSADVTAPGAIINLSAQSGTFPNFGLNWQAPGDDGNAGGKVTAYEVRFSEISLTDTNFDLATHLSGPIPNDPGLFQSVGVKVPWRHPSGFIGVRAVDEAGNKGPISQVPVSVSVDTGDPYIMSEAAAVPVSTGGTALGMIDDDEFKTVNLPFVFKFYGVDYSTVTLSTNGTLYFGFAPNEDFLRSERWVNGRTMIAGLWDDLDTSTRDGDDVYMVQDQDRVIFRWQAVTVDALVGPGVTRGENPVSFEIELRFDGTITLRYGDGQCGDRSVHASRSGSTRRADRGLDKSNQRSQHYCQSERCNRRRCGHDPVHSFLQSGHHGDSHRAGYCKRSQVSKVVAGRTGLEWKCNYEPGNAQQSQRNDDCCLCHATCSHR